MSAKADAMQIPVRSSATPSWRWISLAVALAVAITLVAMGLLRSSGSTEPGTGPAKPPGQVVRPVVAPAQPVTVGGTACHQCR